MKINMADVVNKLRNKTPVSINKNALVDDMNIIYSYYKSDEIPKFMQLYFSKHNNFSLLPFASTYIEQLVGFPINISVADNVVTLYTNN